VVILLQNFCGYFSLSIIPGERLRNEEYLNHRVHREHGGGKEDKEDILFPSVYSVFSVVILLQNFCGYFSSSIIPGERLRNEEI
jgi:hypothetical protein